MMDKDRHWFWVLVDIAFLPISIPLHFVIKGVKFERDLAKLDRAADQAAKKMVEHWYGKKWN